MTDPIDYGRRDPEKRDPERRDVETVETPTETAHRRGLMTGLVVGVIGGAIVGGIIVGMVDTRPAPPGPVATTPDGERRDRLMGVPEESRRDHEFDRDPWVDERREPPGATPGSPPVPRR